MQAEIAVLRGRLDQAADPDTAAWWQNYVKGAPFLGVKMKQIRSLLS